MPIKILHRCVDMIVDITGTILIPGNLGRDCPGNGSEDISICCCDECDYLMCCLDSHNSEECLRCNDADCPHSGKGK